jgi:hypothetical protein
MLYDWYVDMIEDGDFDFGKREGNVEEKGKFLYCEIGVMGIIR